VSQQLVPPPCTGGHELWHWLSEVHEAQAPPLPPLLLLLLPPELPPELPLLPPELPPELPLLPPELPPLLPPLLLAVSPPPLLDPVLAASLPPSRKSAPDDESPEPQAAARMATREAPRILP
jgi:hypothetical protein